MKDDFFEKIGTEVRTSRPGYQSAEVAASGENVASISNATDDGAKRTWAANDNVFWASKQSYDRLPSGLYRCGVSPNIGSFLSHQKIDTDSLIRLPDSESEAILMEIEKFHGMKSEFDKRGFLHKRGVLLWGPPGSGKTSTVNLLTEMVVKDRGGIGVLIDQPQTAASCLQMIRRVEPERPIIALLEDLDALVERHGENEFLALLDGESQVDNIVYVATTNYPERLDRRFVDRPSRFDTVRYISMPSAQARRVYLKAKEPSLSDLELGRFVAETDGLSIAHLRELIILTQCFGQSLAEAVKRLDKFRHKLPSSDSPPDKASFGFGK